MTIMKDTNIFEFKVANGVDKPAIWFKLHGREVIIHPYNLYDILWQFSKRHYICWEIQAEFSFLEDEVCGTFDDEIYGLYKINFDKSSFVESAILALKKCCDAVLGNEEVRYDDYGERAAKQMLIGLKDLKNNDNTIEHFSFEFVEPYACDTAYKIKIGDKEYISALSDWSNDFNKIRLEIENSLFAYYNSKETDIELFFEDSPTIIRLRNKIARVTIIPNEFAKVPNVYGLCEPRQLIRALYLGLLGLCITETDWTEERYGWSWDKFRLATYNKLQSCVIEDYILGVKEDEFTYRPRQRVINTVDEMLVDYKKLQNTLSI